MTAPATKHGPIPARTEVKEPKDGRIIAFRPELARALGNIESALLLTQVLHWMPLARDPDGWVYKTGEQWAEEIGGTISGRTALRRLNDLVKSGYLEKRRNPRSNLDRTTQYRATSKGERVVAGGQNDTSKRQGGESKRQSDHTKRQNDDSIRQDVQSIRQSVETIPEKTYREDFTDVSAPAHEDSPGPQAEPPPRLDDWIGDTFERHGHQISPASVQSLAMRLVGAGDREFVEAYILSTLVNLDGQPTGKVVRALQKNAHIERFRQQESEEPSTQTRTPNRPTNRLEVRDDPWAKTERAQKFMWEPEEI